MHTDYSSGDVSQKIIVALDVETEAEAAALLDQLHGYAIWIKIGNQLGTVMGWKAAIAMVHERGFSIFCDTKFKDIPETVKKSAAALTAFGPDMFNIMADTTASVLEAAVRGKNTLDNSQAPLLLGVTVLTAFSNSECQSIYGASASDKVMQFASQAAAAGLDGVVCSAKEARLLRQDETTKHLLLITPGVRPTWAAQGDQSRVMTPYDAIQAGADYLVIGRPITQPPPEIGSPRAALEKIINELERM